MLGGSNFGELLGAGLLFLLAKKVKKPTIWIILDAVFLNLMWIFPFLTFDEKTDNNLIFAICIVPAMVLTSDEANEETGVNELAAVMSFLYSCYIIITTFIVFGLSQGLDRFNAEKRPELGFMTICILLTVLSFIICALYLLFAKIKPTPEEEELERKNQEMQVLSGVPKEVDVPPPGIDPYHDYVDNRTDPSDVKISYNLQCILVSDYEQASIVCYDLKTREELKTIYISTRQVRHLCIEENEIDDALIFASSTLILKYDLRRLLALPEKRVQLKIQTQPFYLWKSEACKWAQGIAIPYHSKASSTKTVYVCDIACNTIVQLNLQNGELISKIPIDRPFGLAFSQPWTNFTAAEYMIVTQVEPKHTITIFQREQDVEGGDKWNHFKTLGKLGSLNDELRNPCGVVCDHNNGTIIVADCDNARVQIVSLQNFEWIARFGKPMSTSPSDHYISMEPLSPETSFHFTYYPYGLCLNELTGELFVCESENKFE
ncbi:hypothetical protein C9374_008317 [Naegleria lovaniensis]|uniref:Uncharacterized protein n=1 Tax=Naegleria lovaniensis TaxID=51637 RepID=A0AA88GF07_NAELO|nr:uncharacterized protein C9374_008317 [Naegleria lovaniensis]KAG2378174.1 hypothetical protein C9374_008317 [Naegleria lovaniensis]